MKRERFAYLCAAPGCARCIRWALAFCVLCGAKLRRNPARDDKVAARRGLRPRGARGW